MAETKLNNEQTEGVPADWGDRNTAAAEDGLVRPSATVVRLTPKDRLPLGPGSFPMRGKAERERRRGAFMWIWLLNLLGAILSAVASGLGNGFLQSSAPSSQALSWFLAGVASGLLADSWSRRVADGSFETPRFAGLVNRETLTAGALLLLTLSIVCLVLGGTATTAGIVSTAL